MRSSRTYMKYLNKRYLIAKGKHNSELEKLDRYHLKEVINVKTILMEHIDIMYF